MEHHTSALSRSGARHSPPGHRPPFQVWLFCFMFLAVHTDKLRAGGNTVPCSRRVQGEKSVGGIVQRGRCPEGKNVPRKLPWGMSFTQQVGLIAIDSERITLCRFQSSQSVNPSVNNRMYGSGVFGTIYRRTIVVNAAVKMKLDLICPQQFRPYATRRDFVTTLSQ